MQLFKSNRGEANYTLVAAIAIAVMVLAIVPILSFLVTNVGVTTCLPALNAEGYWVLAGGDHTVPGILNPSVDDTYDLGSDALSWQDLYIDGTLYGAIGREATFTVAASDASAKSIAQADYTCDNTADEVQINAALVAGAGGIIHLTEGTFTITNAASIAIPSNTILEGSGFGTIVTCANGGSGAPIIINDTTGGGGNVNVFVRDLKVDGNRAGVGDWTPGITLHNVTGGMVTRCWVQNTYIGTMATNKRGQCIAIRNSSNIVVQDNFAYDSGLAGISVRNNCTNIKILGNTVWDAEWEGIVVATEGADTGQGSTDVLISENYVFGCGLDQSSNGIIVQDQATGAPGNIFKRINIINNVISGNYNSLYVLGYSAMPLETVVISNNTIDTGVGYSLYCSNTDGLALTNNSIISSGNQDAIKIDNASTGTVISGNSIVCYADRYGVFITGTSARCIVENNSISLSGTGAPYGIHITSSANDCVVSGNIITMTQATGTPGGRGLSIDADRVLVQNNRVVCTTPASGVYFAIKIDTGSTSSIIKYNSFVNGYRIAALSDSGTTTVIQDNIGWATENSGNTTITTGNSTLVVAHGLASTPTVIYAEGKHAEVSDLFVDTVGASNFTINVVGGAVSANRNIYWEAKVR